MSEEKPTIFARNKARRAQRVKPLGDVDISDEVKATVCEMVAEGAMITELCERGILPSYWHLWSAMGKDPVFAAKYEDAKTKGAETLLQSAGEHATDMLESADADQVRSAEAFMRITQIYAEKMAPKKFGQLVKLGSDPDAPLTLQVINYALPVIALNAKEARETEQDQRRAIGADDQNSRAQDCETIEYTSTEEGGQAPSTQMVARPTDAPD